MYQASILNYCRKVSTYSGTVLWLLTSCHFLYSPYFLNTNFILVVLNRVWLLILQFSSQYLWPCGECPSQAVLMGANFWWTQEETTHPDRSIQAACLMLCDQLRHSCSFAAVCVILLPHTIAAVWMWCIILDLVSEHQSLATKLPCINMVKVRAFISFFCVGRVHWDISPVSNMSWKIIPVY